MVLGIFIVASLSAQSHSADVDVDSARFVSRDLEVTRIAAGEVAPGHKAGRLIFDFAFESSELDAASASYSLPQFNYAFRFTSVGGAAVRPPGSEGDWWLESEGTPGISPKRFSVTTGGGDATVELPIRYPIGDRVRLPSLPSGIVRCEVAVSLTGSVAISEAGTLVGVDQVHSLDFSVEYPEAWLEIPDGGVPVAGVSTGLLMVREPSPTSRSFTINLSQSGIVDLLDSAGDPMIGGVEVEPNLIGASLDLYGLAPGEVMAEVRSGDGTALSIVTVDVSTEMLGASEISSAGEPAGVAGHLPASASSGSGSIHLHEGSVDEGLYRKCKKAVIGSKGTFHRVCGECGLNPQIPDHCDPADVVFFTQAAACVYGPLSYCSKVSNQVQPAPTYGVHEEYEETTNGCWWVKVNGSGAIAGVASIGADGAVQLSKYCCILKEKPETEWLTVSIEQCKTTSVSLF
ncbi:hypothetical protein [Engelhardtia mirabilis]|uniref:Uncharacterized protein n=1 Tax=Engelhardtia mirabilis TaxID=2528011 RepID=A0A518BQC1_9BACT|nr:hypothetical protein Pla133_42890 [Planctomycetes bacterium Pla133]QDV03499.1 hypothetical protein Pla86_42880 [Planctomycetes bacterium Pla86]